MKTLVDRGANSGITGEDAHIIFTKCFWIASFWSINDHEISLILMITAGRVTNTRDGEVIAILC